MWIEDLIGEGKICCLGKEEARMRFGQTDPELNRNSRETEGTSASLLYLWSLIQDHFFFQTCHMQTTEIKYHSSCIFNCLYTHQEVLGCLLWPITSKATSICSILCSTASSGGRCQNVLVNRFCDTLWVCRFCCWYTPGHSATVTEVETFII